MKVNSLEKTGGPSGHLHLLKFWGFMGYDLGSGDDILIMDYVEPQLRKAEVCGQFPDPDMVLVRVRTS